MPAKTDRKDLLDIGQNCAALRTRMAARGVTRAYDAALRPLGIKITQFTLLVTAKYEADLSIGDMADVLAMERSTLTRNLKLLADMGLIEMRKGSAPRTKVPVITRKGDALLTKAIPIWRDAQARLTAHMGKARWKEARTLLTDLSLVPG
ncbi:MAG: MarR family winged helix-turn-helix transcriptional regulator [Pseudomonadota bacterium]